MNDDTISRQAAIANAISGRTREIDGEKWIRVSEVRESIKTLPPAERHGRWKIIKYPTGVESFGYKEMTVQSLMCSNCSYEIDVSEGYFEYCPNCGSFMDLEYEE